MLKPEKKKRKEKGKKSSTFQFHGFEFAHEVYHPPANQKLQIRHLSESVNENTHTKQRTNRRRRRRRRRDLLRPGNDMSLLFHILHCCCFGLSSTKLLLMLKLESLYTKEKKNATQKELVFPLLFFFFSPFTVLLQNGKNTKGYEEAFF